MSGAGIQLIPIGVGAAYGRPDEVQACHLVRAGGRGVLLDLGAGALNRLCAVHPPERLDLVVITHLHPDHLVDLFSLRIYMAFGPGRGRRLPVLGPPGLRERLIAAAGPDAWDDVFDFQELRGGGEERALGELRLRTAEVPHLDPTHAVRVDHGGRSVCYSADCAFDEALVDLARGCDMLLAECAFGAGRVPDGVPHLDAESAGRLAARAGARTLALTHITPEFDPAEAAAAARAAFGGPVLIARGGQPIAVTATAPGSGSSATSG